MPRIVATTSGGTLTRRQIVGLAITVEAVLVVIALAGAWWWKLPLERWLFWSTEVALVGIGGAGVLLGCLLLCHRFPAGQIARLMKLVDELVKPLFRECRTVDVLVISIVAGVGEELLFRGLIQGGLTLWLVPALGPGSGTALALVVASVLFGLAHYLSLEYAVFATVLGMMLGAMFIVTGNLLVPILAHAIYDFVALLILTRNRP